MIHCVKSFRIRSCSGPYSARMRENTDQNNSEYGHFLYSDSLQSMLVLVSLPFKQTFLQILDV